MVNNTTPDADQEDASDTTDGGTEEQTAQRTGFSFEGPVNLTPEKTGLLQQLSADLDEEGSFYEIFDNSLDAFERVRDGRGKLLIEVERVQGVDGEEIIIRDNAGGVPPEELRVFFSLGSRGDDSLGGVQRGAYGVGVKKATLRLAREVTFATRHIDRTSEEDTGYGFTITEHWLQEEDNWEVDPERFDIEPGVSEIRIRKLRFDWNKYAEQIKDALRSTYRRQLGGGPFTEEHDVTIRFEGETLEPPEEIDWGFPAFDGLHPREFVTDVEPDGLDEPIELRLTVGLMANRDADATGTDLYIQNRLIHEARTDEQGGFGPALGEFNVAQHGRFKMCLSLESEADAAELPWNTTKDRLFPNNELMGPIWDKVRRFADRYFDASFANVPAAYLNFPAGDDLAFNDGELEGPIDYNGRDRVTDKPTNNFPEVDEVEKTAIAHAKLGIQRREHFDDEVQVKRDQMREVYTLRLAHHFEDEFKPGTDHLSAPKPVRAVLPDYGDIDVDLTVEEITSDARAHAEQGVKYTGVEPWKKPLYEAWLEVFTEGRAGTLDLVDDRPDTPEDAQDDEGESGDESERVERSYSLNEEDSATVAEVFGITDDMTAEERGNRLTAAASRLQDLGVSLSLD